MTQQITDIIQKINENIYEIPPDFQEGMRVPGRIFVSQKLLSSLEKGALQQIANVATLPGILKYSMAMPDVHFGYGFPIGGVAAFDAQQGVISPGGVGFDINCGVRVIRTDLSVHEVRPRIKELINELFRSVPSGVGSKSKLRVSDSELNEAFSQGARWAVEKGYGIESDLEHCEDGGFIAAADPAKVSEKAFKRGKPQFGTLGSGNHFLEVQEVDKIYDPDTAKVFGIKEGTVTVMIHCGSRGAGHQICTDYLRTMEKATKKYGIILPDKQLACAPIDSREGQDYFKAMAAGANYAWANRQVITHWVRETFERLFKRDSTELGMELIYDVAHNVAKLEEHEIDGKKQKIYIHRKGATRAFPAGHKDVPAAYRSIGQPVLIPGSMGTPSYILHGADKSMELTFGSACHGAGRLMGRREAKRKFNGEVLERQLADEGIFIKATQPSMLAEEAPEVYKSSSEVVSVVHDLNIARKVVKVIPIGVAKG
jgi:tRNA-splicing ligase RtcB